MKYLKKALILAFVLVLCSCNVPSRSGSPTKNDPLLSPWQNNAAMALSRAMTDLNARRGDSDLLTITNAGYACLDGESTLSLADIVRNETGCTVGQRSLLFVHAPESAPLWFALYRRDTHEAVFSKWADGKFQHQALGLNPDHILTPDGWETAGEGVVSGNLFQVVSFCLVWSAEPRTGLLKSAELHNHICPGVNAGYALAQYIKKRLPLRDGEKYVLVSAPPACPVDGLQTALDCTAGKKAMFTMKTSHKVLGQHEYKKLKPSVIVLRINSAADSCEGSVLAFDFEKACNDLGVSRSNLSPPGGHDNPLFYISRIRIARKMAGMKTEQKMGWIKVLKTFSGKAELADKLAGASFDPYADLP